MGWFFLPGRLRMRSISVPISELLIDGANFWSGSDGFLSRKKCNHMGKLPSLDQYMELGGGGGKCFRGIHPQVSTVSRT